MQDTPDRAHLGCARPQSLILMHMGAPAMCSVWETHTVSAAEEPERCGRDGSFILAAVVRTLRARVRMRRAVWPLACPSITCEPALRPRKVHEAEGGRVPRRAAERIS